jgi:hypothetical protein
MERSDYLGYIAHFVKNVDQLATRSEYRKLFAKFIGTKTLETASDKEVADLARHLYKAYVAHIYTRYSARYLAEKLSSTDIAKLIEDQVALDKKHKIFTDLIDRTLTTSAVDKNIAKQALTSYKLIIEELYAEKAVKKTKPKKSPAKKVTKKPTVAKSSTKSTTVAKSSTKPTLTKPVKKTVTKSVRKCADYLLSELKVMARDKGITGYSKLNKADLCVKLNIK